MAEGEPGFFGGVFGKAKEVASGTPNFERRAAALRRANFLRQWEEQQMQVVSSENTDTDQGRGQETAGSPGGEPSGPVVLGGGTGGDSGRIADALESANLTRTMDEISEFDDASGGDDGDNN